MHELLKTEETDWTRPSLSFHYSYVVVFVFLVFCVGVVVGFLFYFFFVFCVGFCLGYGVLVFFLGVCRLVGFILFFFFFFFFFLGFFFFLFFVFFFFFLREMSSQAVSSGVSKLGQDQPPVDRCEREASRTR